MFVGHYKCVNSPEEFYSKKRESLDFPSQVEVNKKRYMLSKTYHVASESKYKDLIDVAKKNSIQYDIEVK
jgi:hypothetical protein